MNGGTRVCFVVSHKSFKAILYVSYYSQDQRYIAKLNGYCQEQLTNVEPSEHDAIHDELGKPFGVDGPSTMQETRHNHWSFPNATTLEQLLDIWGGIELFVHNKKKHVDLTPLAAFEEGYMKSAGAAKTQEQG
jgi:hypothetical protein